MKNLFIFILSLFSILANAQAESNYSRVTDWVSSKDLNKRFYEEIESRFYPSYIEGKVDKGHILYRATFSPFLLGQTYCYSRWGMDDLNYAASRKYYLYYGYQESFHTTFLDLSGNTIHMATWVLIGKQLHQDEEMAE